MRGHIENAINNHILDRFAFMGMPASGKKMSWTAIATNRIENGKIVERWFNSDVFGMLQQFGLIPGGQS